MTVDNTEQNIAEEAEFEREMGAVLAVARETIPDEALTQSFLIVRFLNDTKTFATRKRVLERLLRRPIQLQRPLVHAELDAAFKRANQAGHSAKILQFPTTAKH